MIYTRFEKPERTFVTFRTGWLGDYDLSMFPEAVVVAEKPGEVTAEIFWHNEFYGNENYGDNFKGSHLEYIWEDTDGE